MIKVVTDSSSDLSPEIAAELGITVVPLYIRFGDEIYREHITITLEEFYQRLVSGGVHPVTIQPSPGDFISTFEKTAQGADGIVSIHISSKMSGTYNSALQAKGLANVSCPIEVIDSQMVSVALGAIVVAAAEAANRGGSMQDVLQATREAIAKTRPVCLLDTLKYLQLGGRIAKAEALLGTMLNIKPIITLKEGEVVPYGRVRSRQKGLEQLTSFVENNGNLDDVLISYATTADDARALAERFTPALNGKQVRYMRLGTVMGVHVGPGSIVVALREK
ncbi:MAG: DegV family protein [Dehalococcoidia bacterium]|nr:MAG: DegV family protein [Dehalococcoidia bacterium]